MCGHSLCKECLIGAMRPPALAKCPFCRDFIFVIDRRNPGRINIVMDQAIRTLQVRCTNSPCKWQGTLTDAEVHHIQCGEAMVECCHCQKPSRRGSDHEVECPAFPVECRVCKFNIRRDHEERHKGECEELPQPCPLGCRASLPRSSVYLHAFVCPERVIKCDVKGCCKTFPLQAFNEHSTLYQESHQQLLRQELQRIKQHIFNKDGIQVQDTRHEVRAMSWSIQRGDLDTHAPVLSTAMTVDLPGTQAAIQCGVGPNECMVRLATSPCPLLIRARFYVDGTERCRLGPAVLKEGDCRKATTRLPAARNNALSIRVLLFFYFLE